MQIADLPPWLASRITEQPDGCWVSDYTPSRPSGYCSIQIDGRDFMLHRLVRHLIVGDVEARCSDRKNDTLDHLCRRRECCNPSHLEPVTNQENQMRAPATAAAINSAKTHCPHGHPLVAGNLAASLKRQGWRGCLTCARIRSAKWSAKRGGKDTYHYLDPTSGERIVEPFKDGDV